MADLKKLDEIVDELGVQSENLKSFAEIYRDIEKLKDEIGANVSSFESGSKELKKASEDVKAKLQELTAQQTEIKASLLQRIALIEENNKKFQKEFESSNVSRLERFKSDIEVTVRSEGHETANTIENKLNTTFLKELNNINKRTLFLIMFGVAIVGLNIYMIQNLTFLFDNY